MSRQHPSQQDHGPFYASDATLSFTTSREEPYTQGDRCVAEVPIRTLLATANYRPVTVPLEYPYLALARRGREPAGSRGPPRRWQRTWVGAGGRASVSRRDVASGAIDGDDG